MLTTLWYHVDMDWLREAYRRTRKDGAAGVDEVTAAECERDLIRFADDFVLVFAKREDVQRVTRLNDSFMVINVLKIQTLQVTPDILQGESPCRVAISNGCQ